MLSLSILFISLLCGEIYMAENYYDKKNFKTSGPYFVSKEAVNWTDAKRRCQIADLELASVISEEEKEALTLYIKENKFIPEDKWSGFWLSGVRRDDGKYYWDSTGTEVDSSFRGWAWGEPSHAYGKENCIELKWDQLDLGWNDYFCDETRRYICQIPRKLKSKGIKKNLNKQLIQKEGQYIEHEAYDFMKTLEPKESEVYGEPAESAKDAEDYNWTTLGESYNYTIQGEPQETVDDTT